MDSNDLQFINLFNETQIQVREQLDELWNEKSSIKINFTEGRIIEKIHSGIDKVVEITQEIQISRQATHKFLKELESKQIVELFNDEENKKLKRVRLTEIGLTCYKEYQQLKLIVQENLIDEIGQELKRIVNELI